VGEGVDEKGVDEKGVARVCIEPSYFRPAEVDMLIGDPAKAKAKLGWSPKVTFAELVRIMTEHDLELASKEEWMLKRK
jgi:GDPmannose 4,6-dehydratase